MYDPQYPRRNRLFRILLLLAAFALGVHAERRGWLPRGPAQEPSEARETFQPFWETWYLVHEKYVDQESVNNERMTQGAILGMLATLGDLGHTTYLTRDEVKRLQESLKGEFEGIGASIALRKQGPTIVQTMPKSPARRAGLKAGDVIVQVDSATINNTISLQQLVQNVRGPAGSTVHLKVLRGDPPEKVALDIERAKVDVPDVSWQMLPKVPLAHVAIRSFGEHTDAQLRVALAAARKDGAKGLILDLRGNPGGLKEQAVKVTSEFLKAGEVVFIEKDSHGKTTPVAANPNGVAQEIPLCVLINDGTASSAEILAGAVQDYQRGKLIGERTFGTGTVLREYKLSDGSAVLLAVDQWLTPKERQIWHKGIAPDIKVELPPGTAILLPESETKLSVKALTDSKDTQLLKAIEVLKKELVNPLPRGGGERGDL
jgi:carboxyl-terminal processing protease